MACARSSTTIHLFPARRSPSACGRARSTSSSARTHLLGPGRPLRAGHRRAARCSRSSSGARPAPARRRSRASSPASTARDFVRVQRRDVRASRRSARSSARPSASRQPARPAHDPVHRRDPPLQQGAAGRLPAARRGRRRSSLIGATTENPSFEVNSALLSRSEGLRPAAAVDRTTSAPSCAARLTIRSAASAACQARSRRRRAARRSRVYANGDARVALNLLDGGARRCAPKPTAPDARLGRARAELVAEAARCSTTRPARSTTT